MKCILPVLLTFLVAGCDAFMQGWEQGKARARARHETEMLEERQKQAQLRGPEKYAIVSIETAGSKPYNRVVRARPSDSSTCDGCMKTFERDDCADAIKERFGSGYDNPGAVYIKNGLVRGRFSDGGDHLARYICLPLSAVVREKSSSWEVDISKTVGVPATLDLAKADSYSILPLEDADVARSENERLNKIATYDPSFSCDNLDTLSENERHICRSPSISRRDRELAALYKRAGEPAKAGQREWLAKARAAKPDDLADMYDARIDELAGQISDCAGAEKIIRNIKPGISDADVQLLKNCADSPAGGTSAIRKTQVQSAVWLGYLLFESDPAQAKKYISFAVDFANNHCEDFGNFCYMSVSTDGRPYEMMNILLDCVGTEMLRHDIEIVKNMGPRFGSSRDAGLMHICDDENLGVSIAGIKKTKGFEKISAVLDPDEKQGTMWVAIRRGQWVEKLLASQFPNDIDRAKYPVEKFARVEEEMKKYPDAQTAYNQAVAEAQNFYKKTFGMAPAQAKDTAEHVIKFWLIQDLNLNGDDGIGEGRE